jgi:hypothetical protein
MNRETKRTRLTDAGFRHVAVWVPAAYAAKVDQQAAFYAEDVAKVLAPPVRPRGRPRNGE